ncbi:MAG: RNA polymerase subunit sigma, partial [Xanthomonadales bacterium PRO6]|nr:RNA polymerase subunit sigma [Xanthomonadales bacterium PRO6]
MVQGPITQLLRRRAAGDPAADAALAPLVYEALHALAERQMRGERAGHSLTPTALIHEAWLRLAGEQALEAADRAQFYALAA